MHAVPITEAFYLNSIYLLFTPALGPFQRTVEFVSLLSFYNSWNMEFMIPTQCISPLYLSSINQFNRFQFIVSPSFTSSPPFLALNKKNLFCFERRSWHALVLLKMKTKYTSHHALCTYQLHMELLDHLHLQIHNISMTCFSGGRISKGQCLVLFRKQ